MSRRDRPPADGAALHMGRLLQDALLKLAPVPREGEAPLSAGEIFARRRIWRIASAAPLAIRDDESLAAVLRRVLKVGYDASRIAKQARSRRGGQGRARTVKESATARRERLRAEFAALHAKNARIGEDRAADLLGVNRKTLRAALGKSR